MKEYIEREVALEILCDGCCEYTIENPFACEGCEQKAEVLRIPAADVAPVIHGEWNVGSIGIHCYCECSICKQETPAGMETKFCPNCDARMDGGNK